MDRRWRIAGAVLLLMALQSGSLLRNALKAGGSAGSPIVDGVSAILSAIVFFFSLRIQDRKGPVPVSLEPVVSKFAVPLIRKPVPGPSLPATSRLPSVITTRGSLDMLASVLCMYPAGISILSPAENRT